MCEVTPQPLGSKLGREGPAAAREHTPGRVWQRDGVSVEAVRAVALYTSSSRADNKKLIFFFFKREIDLSTEDKI